MPRAMTQAELSHAFNLAPKAVIDYLKAKHPEATWNWTDLQSSAHSKAFTVAKALKLDVVKTIQDSLISSLEKGITEQEFIKQLNPRLKALGWWGRQEQLDYSTGELIEYKVNPWRLRTIYRTNMQTAFAAGRFKAQMEDEFCLYLEYRSKRDSQVRPEHAVMDGMIFPKHDPIWLVIYAPNGFGCRCDIVGHSQYSVDSKGLKVRKSDGQLTLIEQRIGRDGNMPITRQGIAYRLPMDVNKFDAKSVRITSFAPDAGWSNNTGSPYYFANLSKYNKALSSHYITELMQSPVFDLFYASRNSTTENLQRFYQLNKQELRDALRHAQKWPIGVLSNDLKQVLKSNSTTVMLSDDALGKPVPHNVQGFGLHEYKKLQDVIESADEVWRNPRDGRLHFIKQDAEKRLYAVIKAEQNENYLVSYRFTSEKEWQGFGAKYQRIK